MGVTNRKRKLAHGLDGDFSLNKIHDYVFYFLLKRIIKTLHASTSVSNHSDLCIVPSAYLTSLIVNLALNFFSAFRIAFSDRFGRM